MQYRVDHSSTSVKLRILLDVLGLTEASAGLIISTIADNESTATRYRSSSSEIENITTIGTFAAPTAGKCRFKAVDATNHPYLYEIQLANARFAVAGATSMLVTITGAGIRAEGIHIPIDLPQAPHTTASIANATSSQIATDIVNEDAGWETAQQTIAAFVEAALLNDSDGQAFKAALNTLVQQLFDAEADVPVTTLRDLIVAGVWANGTRTLTSLAGLTVGQVTNLTNLPTIPANWITTAGITDGAFTAGKFAASSLNGKGDWETEATAATRQTAVLDAIDEAEEDIKDHGDGPGNWDAGVVGPGMTQYPVRIMNNGIPIGGARVWITTDLAGLNQVAGVVFTLSDGTIQEPFLLESGQTYYLWAAKGGYYSIGPESFTVP